MHQLAAGHVLTWSTSSAGVAALAVDVWPSLVLVVGPVAALSALIGGTLAYRHRSARILTERQLALRDSAERDDQEHDDRRERPS